MPNVWWTGNGHSYTISAAQWAQAGITSGTTEWNADNGWSINESAFTSDQMTLLEQQGDFTFGNEGPRERPGPFSIGDSKDSAYIYYKFIKDVYDELTENGYISVDVDGIIGASTLGKAVLEASGGSDIRTLIGAVSAVDITTAINAVIDAAPGALNTLNELAAALGDDPNFAATITALIGAKADDATTASALALKAPLANPTFTGTVSGVTKTHVGLGNVDNTADSDKPVSAAQQSALNLKAPLANPAFTGTPTGITKVHVGLNNVDNTADVNKPISDLQQTALNLKSPIANSKKINGKWVPGLAYVVGEISESPYGNLMVRKTTGNARSSFDATEQALWTSSPYSSDYWCDINNSFSRSLGEYVTQSTLLTHDTPGTPGYVEVSPVVANKVAGFSGYTTGVIGAGGVLPTGWESANGAVAKTLTYANIVSMQYSMTLSPTVSAGLRTPEYSGVNSGDWEVSFYLDIYLDNPELYERTSVWVNWATNSKGLTMASPLGLAKGGGRLVFTLPPADVANDKLVIIVQNNATSGDSISPVILISNLLVSPSISNELKDANPAVFATQAARSATLNVPNGNYVLFVWTDRGIISANATASGGTGINIRNAIGSAKIYKIAAWISGNYREFLVDDDHRYSSVYSTDTAILASMHTKTVGVSKMFLHGPNKEHSYKKSLSYWNRDICEVKPGDNTVNSFTTSDFYKRRSELVSMKPMPYDQDVWLSFPFRVTGTLNIPAAWGIIFQWRYTDQPGDTIGLSPEFALVLGDSNSIRADSNFSTDSNPSVNPTATTRWTGQYTPGKLHRFVGRFQFSRTGGGKLGMWFDGTEVYAFQDTPIGYNKTNGSQAHWGFYGVQSNDTIKIEHFGVEFGTQDLSSRILTPIPV